MELIIKIDDKDKKICEQYVNGKLGDELGDYVNITELADAIANGIPCEPKGDLISREALKEQTKNDYCKNHCPLPNSEYYCPFNCSARYFIKLIDNAPTISPYKAIHDELHKGEEE